MSVVTEKSGGKKRWRLAAPSWVFPGTIVDNCVFLEGKVDEVALLFFETQSSLGYSRQELPLALASLALTYHVHLPLDLPWEKGGGFVAETCLRLMEKVDLLGVTQCVLHPPAAMLGDSGVKAMDAFAGVWALNGRAVSDVLVENTRENSLECVWRHFADAGFGFCIDLGHMLAYDQQAAADIISEFRVGMLHINAPGRACGGKNGKSAHLPVDALSADANALGRRLCAGLTDNGVIVAEFFEWSYVERSIAVIEQWCGPR